MVCGGGDLIAEEGRKRERGCQFEFEGIKERGVCPRKGDMAEEDGRRGDGGEWEFHDYTGTRVL